MCGSENKPLRDNQTISPDGGKGQTKDAKLMSVSTERGIVFSELNSMHAHKYV